MHIRTIAGNVLINMARFFPLSLFAGYALWEGEPTFDRWVEAYQIGAVAAVVQLLFMVRPGTVVNRLALGGAVYLILGALAAVTEQWWYLNLYSQLQESGVFCIAIATGALATLLTNSGYVGVRDGDPARTFRYSLFLLAATLVALAVSLPFRGEPLWAVVLPFIALSILQNVMAKRLQPNRAAPDHYEHIKAS